MKEPKTFKRPRLYYLSDVRWDRIRILYPDGHAIWIPNNKGYWRVSCYSRKGKVDGWGVLWRMLEYDRSWRFNKAEFVCEL